MKKFILIMTVLTTMVSGSALTQESTKPKKPTKKMTREVTPEQRKNMAAMHEKMAKCLRSDKSISECRSEMHEQCMSMMGRNGCPIMDQMGGMMGGGNMHHGGMMDGQDDKR